MTVVPSCTNHNVLFPFAEIAPKNMTVATNVVVFKIKRVLYRCFIRKHTFYQITWCQMIMSFGKCKTIVLFIAKHWFFCKALCLQPHINLKSNFYCCGINRDTFRSIALIWVDVSVALTFCHVLCGTCDAPWFSIGT